MNKLLVIVFLTSFIASSSAEQLGAFAQSASLESRKPTEAELQKIQDVIKHSDSLVREGEDHLRNKEFAKARGKFDQAVNAVLESGLDVRAFPVLQKYYLDLVERIYKLETSMQIPPKPSSAPPVGFVEQKFEPSPLDELSKIELSPAVSLTPPKPKPRVADSTLIGQMPRQLADGRVPIVIHYLQENLNDPYSMKLLRWARIQKVYRYEEPFWYVRLRMRAKNGFGAYILKEVGFYIRRLSTGQKFDNPTQGNTFSFA
jgi:hypothetical protein